MLKYRETKSEISVANGRDKLNVTEKFDHWRNTDGLHARSTGAKFSDKIFFKFFADKIDMLFEI